MRGIAAAVTVTFLSFAALGAEMTRQQCRGSADSDLIADCIEAHVYDPCDDAGGTQGYAQCGWAHAEVAERRIKKAIKTLKQQPAMRATWNRLDWSQKNFELYRDQYCDVANEAHGTGKLTGESAAYCYRRLNEQRADELEKALVKPEQSESN